MCKVRFDFLNVAAMACAIIMILSLFLTWHHAYGDSTFAGVRVQIFDVRSKGIEGDGPIFLGLAILCFILALFSSRWATVPGVVSAILGVATLTRDTRGWTLVYDTGIYLSIVTSLVFTGCTAAFWLRVRKSPDNEAVEDDEGAMNMQPGSPAESQRRAVRGQSERLEGDSAKGEPGVPGKPMDEVVRFTCECGQRIRMPAKYAGRTGKCPKCSAHLRVPEVQAR